MKQPVAEALCECRATREYNVAIECLAKVHVGAVYGLDDNLVHARVFQTDNHGVEEDLGCAKAFRANLPWSAPSRTRVCVSVCVGAARVTRA